MTHPHLPLMLVGSIFVLTLALPGGAQATDAHFEDERDHARANIIRERAVERSKRALQPDDKDTLRNRFETELKPYLAVAPDRTILTVELWLEEFFEDSNS